ncbi:MAG: hypothetical protein H5U37_01120, partial [Caldisericia bacterium]|nr:hypothetical protein [Caldisericia bacterium]
MLKNKFLIIIFLLSIFIPKLVFSQEIEKIYSFNENFNLNFKDGFIEIETNLDKDLTGLPFKNIKIYYDSDFEFLSY